MKSTYPQFVAKFLLNDYLGLTKKYHRDLSAHQLSPIIKDIYEEKITRATGKRIIEEKLSGIKREIPTTP